MKTKKLRAADNILTQALNNELEIRDELDDFFQDLNIPEVLKKYGCVKRSGMSTDDILKDILSLRLERISVEENAQVGKVPTRMSKDAWYRFLQRQNTDWTGITTALSHALLCKLIPGYEEDTDIKGMFIIDDTPFKREYSFKTEMLSRQYDHASHTYYIGVRLSVLGYVCKEKEIPVNGVLVTSTDSDKYMAPQKAVDPDSPAAVRREQARSQLNEVIFDQVKTALEMGIKADHVAFDSWFSTPKTIMEFKNRNMDVIGRMKTGPVIKYLYEGEKLTLEELCNRARFTPPTCSDPDIFFSVKTQICSGEKTLPVKIVFCRNYSNSPVEFVAVLSTDPELSDQTILRLYRGRWKEEVMNHEMKSKELNLLRSNQSVNLDSICASVAIVIILYLFLHYFKEPGNNPDSVRQSFYKRSAHAANGRIGRALCSTMQALVQYLERNHGIDREKLIEELSEVVLKNGAFNFYLKHLPLSQTVRIE